MKPEVTFKVGAVRASVFLNRFDAREGGVIETYSVNLHRRFQDGEGEWKSNSTFRLAELPQAALALQLATNYVAEREASTTIGTENGQAADEPETVGAGSEY